jgi:H2-forming N5,N10-methylenetetrahydromethanopterin dehydrogenase-like enzyme
MRACPHGGCGSSSSGQGASAAAEGALIGTHDGVLHTPNGDVAPTGRAVDLRWAAVYVTDGDTSATRERSDTATLCVAGET